MGFAGPRASLKKRQASRRDDSRGATRPDLAEKMQAAILGLEICSLYNEDNEEGEEVPWLQEAFVRPSALSTAWLWHKESGEMDLNIVVFWKLRIASSHGCSLF